MSEPTHTVVDVDREERKAARREQEYPSPEEQNIEENY